MTWPARMPTPMCSPVNSPSPNSKLSNVEWGCSPDARSNPSARSGARSDFPYQGEHPARPDRDPKGNDPAELKIHGEDS
jgi:hypothetical protein